MKHIISSSDIRNSEEKLKVFEILKSITSKHEGVIYYKYPISGTTENYIPDFSIIDYNRGILLIDIINLSLESIIDINNDYWTIDNSQIDPPHLRLEDYAIGLENRFRKNRVLRDKVLITSYILLPFVNKDEFICKFHDFKPEMILFDNYNINDYEELWNEVQTFTEEEKKLFISLSQGAGSLNHYKGKGKIEKANKIGKAIKLLDSKIAILDEKQHEAAIQIPDGPQRIRGMAGTGKTIILTMKAAYLHSRFPNMKILYTFHTQSLYNQIRQLITKFYRESEDRDPNWENLLILHSWGGKAKEGVYYRTCLRNSIKPLTLRDTPYDNPLGFVCSDALKNEINEEFDFVLMDESQDFPNSFFQLIYKITREPKRIIFAYDELQNLTAINIQDTGELFGYNEDGSKKVDFSKGEYFGNIEMDFVLEKSYRNPNKLLMVAHGIGMGIYNTDGIMQIIDDENIWRAIGYKVIKGHFKKDSHVIIDRPEENSVSLVHEAYSGKQDCLIIKNFDNITDEISWIASSIKNDIYTEEVEPHHIIVISLKTNSPKNEFIQLQAELHTNGVPSIIPGADGIDRDKFGEIGFVTLSSVFKAKGNEAFIVYVMNFDHLYDYIDFVNSRNKAFTSIIERLKIVSTQMHIELSLV